MLVSKKSYSLLVGEALGGSTDTRLTFVENALVNGTLWERIEKLSAGGEGWPRSATYIAAKHMALQQELDGGEWPNRRLALKEAYEAALAKAEPSADATSRSDL